MYNNGTVVACIFILYQLTFHLQLMAGKVKSAYEPEVTVTECCIIEWYCFVKKALFSLV